MRMYDIIMKKRDGFPLNDSEIDFFVSGVTDGSLPDYQISALLMAIFLRGMNEQETAKLTLSMAHSGDMVDLSPIEGMKADKHSTGGVGDKTTLVVAPVVASCGIKVAKMSGRGLGHTGGTVDKLESIPGLRTAFEMQEFFDIVNKTGIAVIGQSGNLAPADKKLYALRDVTATVDNISLIAASIMSKKLASGSDVILLDVKTGSGAFMKTEEDAKKLADAMVDIGLRAGRKCDAVISNMDVPLGIAIGNSLEVMEAVDVLMGKGPKDLVDDCVILATKILVLSGMGSYEDCEKLVYEKLANKEALTKLCQMVEAQGGDPEYITNSQKFAKPKYSLEVKALKSGRISFMDTQKIGITSVVLGAGRATKEDAIDYAAGLYVHKKTGQDVAAGEVVATLVTNDSAKLSEANELYLSAMDIV